MRAVIYARYSAGPRQTDQSIEGQVRDCRAYCEQHDLEVIEIYADRHISGKTDERPEFQRLIAESKKNKFDAVVVWKTDRFARNKYDSAIYKRELQKNGVKIFYAAEAIPEGPEGIILESLMEGLAEYYSAELAQKIKRGMVERAHKGKILGGTTPLGYKASPEHTYIIDEDEAPAVKTIFKMYIDGETNAAICDYLNEKGIKTSQGHAFNKNSINRIITNEKYIGTYKAAGVVIEDLVPPIIDKETFRLAQEEMEKKKIGKKGRRGVAEYLLSGKLYCGHCESAMVGVSGTSRTGKKHYYYYCPGQRKKKKTCDKKPVQRDFIEELVVQKTVEFVLQPKVMNDLADKLYSLQSDHSEKEEKLAYYKRKLSDNKLAINRILDAIEKGLGEETLLERLQALQDERNAIADEITEIERSPLGAKLSRDHFRFFLEQFVRDEGEDFIAYKKRIIKGFISKVYLTDEDIELYYNITGDSGELKKQNSRLSTPVQRVRFDESPANSTLLTARRTQDAITTIALKCSIWLF